MRGVRKSTGGAAAGRAGRGDDRRPRVPAQRRPAARAGEDPAGDLPRRGRRQQGCRRSSWWSLRGALDRINPELEQRSLWGRTIGLLPFMRDNAMVRALKKVALRYEPVSKQIVAIETKLRQGRTLLARDNVELRRLYEDVEAQQQAIQRRRSSGASCSTTSPSCSPTPTIRWSETASRPPCTTSPRGAGPARDARGPPAVLREHRAHPAEQQPVRPGRRPHAGARHERGHHRAGDPGRARPAGAR